MILMRSITLKLILSFLSISLVSVLLIVLFARYTTDQEFRRFTATNDRSSIVETLHDYYTAQGSWDGIEQAELYRRFPDPNDFPTPNGNPLPKPYSALTVTDQFGKVIRAGSNHKLGNTLPAEEFQRGTLIQVDGETVGYLIFSPPPFDENSPERSFLKRTTQLLVYSALAATAIALLLAVLLSRSLTSPIRELTEATHAVSEGDLSQQVPIRSNDELGELGRAFNKMSTELARSVNVRKQMTADIAHELRTPLSLILGHAEAVHDGVLPPTLENFEIIREEATRLEHLVDDLRTLSLADAGELSINLQTIEPGRLLQEVASLYQYQTQRKNIALDLDIASPLATIEVDPGRITQVLTNVLDNALRHTPDGGKIILSAKEVNGQIELAVHDSGPGLKAEELDRIFQRFYRTDASRQREDYPGGSGLGLAIAKSIVQAHGGQVFAESETGEGLKVIVTLPKKI
ncbi:MAG: HAMP domain-containing protein [Chloroflexi bacterium]|nr:MAG: HAMP domain-containing protein [Chloroflexota bacterium]